MSKASSKKSGPKNVSAVLEDASSKDLDRLYEIEKECFKEEAFTKKEISRLLNDCNTVNLVARVQTNIAGFVVGMIHVERSALRGHVLTIDVAPAYRRKGIGMLLMGEIESIFKQKGVKASFLEVREDNASAMNLYLKLGYRIIGRLENYYGKTDGIYLKKILS
jgi:ribosomal-protein-alanine N-acetyltransferase